MALKSKKKKKITSVVDGFQNQTNMKDIILLYFGICLYHKVYPQHIPHVYTLLILICAGQAAKLSLPAIILSV